MRSLSAITPRKGGLPSHSAEGAASSRMVVGVLLALAVAGYCIFASSQSSAQTAHPTQEDVEAAYLYNFGKFVHWPANLQQDQSHAPLAICIVGKDPFGASLDNIVANEVIDGRSLTVRRLPDTATALSCSILFLGDSEAPILRHDLQSLRTLPILTVSDMPAFAAQGGMIQFILQNGRVRFEVNLSAATRCGLKLSSQLLKVASAVVDGPNREGSQ